MTLLKRVWTWIRGFFMRRLSSTAGNTNRQTARKKRRGILLWDGRLGTYRRGTKKIGRNESCPCGAMRSEPQDTNKPAKFKHCCGKPK